MSLAQTIMPVPRTPEDPSPQEVYMSMQPGEPYAVSELAAQFDASRWTIRNRLEGLVDDGFVSKKKHGKNRVTYWIPCEQR